MTEQTDDLLTIFWVEAHEYLESLNNLLLQLEMTAPGEEQQTSLREVSRVAHSLKGASRVVGQHAIETLAHQMEDIFDAVLAERLTLEPEVCDVLYDALDLIQGIADGNGAAAEAVETVLDHLGAVVADAGPVENKRKTLVIEPAPLITLEEVTPVLPVISEDTIRVRVGKLDQLMGQASELLVARMHSEQRRRDLRAILQAHRRWHRFWRQARGAYIRTTRRLRHMDQGGQDGDLRELMSFFDATQQYMIDTRRQLAALNQTMAQDALHLTTLVDALQDDIASARMLPFETITSAFQRLVRDLGRESGKEIHLFAEGVEVELDKHVLELLKDPLMHLLRNAVDHGIESPEEREAAGKPAVGTIRLIVAQRGNDIQVSVADDGHGLNVDAIRRRAVDAGLFEEAEIGTRTPDEIAALIFRAGFSTADEVTEVSGRGVGLDVVQKRVEALRGRVWIENSPGVGAAFHLLVPVSLTRLRCLLTRVGDETYAVPLAAVVRIIYVTPEAIFHVDNRPMIEVLGRPVPLLHLGEVLDRPGAFPPPDDKTPILVLQSAERAVALIVDELQSERELVLKKLGPELSRVRYVTGAAILGTGEVVIVLNASDLIKSARRGIMGAPGEAEALTKPDRPAIILVVDDSLTTRTLERQILEAAGYHVSTATDGDEALRLLMHNAYDLIVTDVQMPNMDGFELTRRIKGDLRWQHIPVIVVTSLDSPGDRELGLHAGADAYLVKPDFDQDVLLQTIEKMV